MMSAGFESPQQIYYFLWRKKKIKNCTLFFLRAHSHQLQLPREAALGRSQGMEPMWGTLSTDYFWAGGENLCAILDV